MRTMPTLESPTQSGTDAYARRERTARLMRTFVSRVIEQELRPRVAETWRARASSTAAGGTATVQSGRLKENSVDLRITRSMGTCCCWIPTRRLRTRFR